MESNNGAVRRTTMPGLSRYGLLLIIFLCLAGISSTPSSLPAAEEAGQKIYVIPMTGEVGPVMAAFLERALREADAGTTALFVLELDTFGGRVDSALQIVDTLLHVRQGKTIAFVKNKAISAGALIALACNELVMSPHTTIGDCAPITYSGEGPKMMGEKFQSPLRAKFRALAKRNGYPETLAEAMVTAEMEVYRVVLDNRTMYLDSEALTDLPQQEKERISSRKTVVAKGELLTMDDTEAHQFGFSRLTAVSLDDMLTKMNIKDPEIVRFQENWSEKLGILISTAAPILMMIGLAALYMELKAPGFGLPGIIGITCLGLVFLNQYLIGLADYTDLLLIVLGVALLCLEYFVFPGFGIAGLAGIFCLGAGMLLSFQDFVVPDPALPWQKELLFDNLVHVLGSFLFAFVTSLLFLRYIFPRMGSVVEGPYLSTTLAGSRASSEEADMLQTGDTGIALTFLRPAGKGRFGNDVYDVISEGEFLEKDTELVVRAVKGNRIIVGKRGAP